MKSNTLLRLGVLSALAAAMSGLGGSAAEAVVPPPPFGSVHFPYNDFYAVPQLGTEAVLGSGCGANGTIGETIPDGIWRGRIDSFDLDVVIEATSLQFNLICVFVGETGARERAEWEAANPGDQQYGFPDGFMVDNNPRLRTPFRWSSCSLAPCRPAPARAPCRPLPALSARANRPCIYRPTPGWSSRTAPPSRRSRHAAKVAAR